MELFSYTKKIARDVGKRLNKEYVLSEEIWLHYKKQIPFSQIRMYINNKGYQFILETFNKNKDKDYTYFLAIVSRTKLK